MEELIFLCEEGCSAHTHWTGKYMAWNLPVCIVPPMGKKAPSPPTHCSLMRCQDFHLYRNILTATYQSMPNKEDIFTSYDFYYSKEYPRGRFSPSEVEISQTPCSTSSESEAIKWKID